MEQRTALARVDAQAPFVYGWDWTIWLASCGIWKSVYLTAIPHAALTDVYARTEAASLAEGQPCTVQVTVEALLHDAADVILNCSIYDMEGAKVAACHQPLSDGKIDGRLTIQHARLWWCNGMGEPYLYTLTVTLEDAHDAMLDSFNQKLGLRTIELIEPELENAETRFPFVLNGDRCSARARTMCPATACRDALPGKGMSVDHPGQG